MEWADFGDQIRQIQNAKHGDAFNACWVDSYNRGAGRLFDTCPEGMERWGTGCFPKCKEGYKGSAAWCTESACPEGFKSVGNFCMKPKSYNRGKGYWSKKKAQKKYDDVQKYGLMWFKKCKKDHYGLFGLCVPSCPKGMFNWGVSCAKRQYNRGFG